MRELVRSAWLVVAAALFPLLLFLVFQNGFAAREQRRAIEARSLSSSQIVSAASDAVLSRSIAGLEALSTIQALPVGDIPTAYARTRQIAALNPDWVTVKLARVADGAQLFDLRRPLGASLLANKPRAVPAKLQVAGVQRDGKGCPCVVIETRAPGPGAGYLLSALVSTSAFERLLPPNDDRVPVSAIVDGEGRFVARSLHQAERVGLPGSPSLRQAVASRKATGIYRGTTLEGVENYTAFARSDLSGWSAHVALGVRYIDDPTTLFLSSLGVAALLSIALAAVLIWFALRQMAEGRKIADRGQQQQKLEALGQLTGGIAHDFNNLLTPVVGALDYLIKRSDLDARARRIADGALASARRAGKLTAQLLAFSRRQKLAIAPLDVPLLFEELQPMLEQSVGKDHQVEVAISGGAQCVRSDHNQLELALLNLVINARDAMPDGGIIRVELDTESKDGGQDIVIRVIDQGEGMSRDIQRRAVEPFFTTKAQGRGTGLGLAQVFGVMQQSGGSVEIDSAVGRGTVVTLRLPSCDEAPAPRCRPSQVLRVEARALRLLLVDDDPAVRATIARSFEDGGHVINSVGDGRVALTAIQHCDYDLVIVDFAMPMMDGAAVIREARKLRPEVKFLMVTGYADSEAVAAACPDTAVIRKPFESEALMALVAELTAPEVSPQAA